MLKIAIKDAYTGLIRNAEDAIKFNPNKFWGFINSRNNTTSIPSVMNYNNINLDNPQDIVNNLIEQLWINLKLEEKNMPLVLFIDRHHF